MPSVIIGKDAETRQDIRIGDSERRSGLYLLGRPGTGKTTLIKNIIAQDIANGHGVFFLDPHGDAIEDLQRRIPANRQDDVIVLDPADELYSFGINLLACPDPHNMTQLTRTFAPVIEVFKKLFANVQTEELDILLNQYLRNSFFPLIANQGYTLAEIPLFLTDKQFRDRLLQHPSIRPQVVRFWHDAFDRLPQDDQRKEIASTLRRLDFFEDYDQIRHIVGQSASTLHFSDIMDKGKILFVKLSATLPPDVKRIIGTILISNLVHAVLLREQLPEERRRHFCIFVDEFQNFASSDDFAVLFTQARKYAIATTIAHQERYGQFADNKRISGATDAAVNKIFFQVSVRDAREQAPEFAKEATSTETRLEPEIVISPDPFWDLIRKGHANPTIQSYVKKYWWLIHADLEHKKDEIETGRAQRTLFQDQATLYRDQASLSQTDEREENRVAAMARNRAITLNYSAIDRTRNAIEQTREAHYLVAEQNQELLHLQKTFVWARERIDAINKFLTSLMAGESTIDSPNALFADFLLCMLINLANYHSAVGEVFFKNSSLLNFYLSLRFDERKKALAIPAWLLYKYWPEEMETVYRKQQTQLREAWHQEALAENKKRRNPLPLQTVEEVVAQDMKHYRNSKVVLHIGRAAIRGQGFYDNKNQVAVEGSIFPLPDYPKGHISEKDRAILLDICGKEIQEEIHKRWTIPTFFQIIDDLTDFCRLLKEPENHMRIPSGQYIEKKIHVRPVHDMTDEMAQELIDLRPHTAYVKSVWKGKIQTVDVERVPGARLVDVSMNARQNAIDEGIFKLRSDIEEEIRERQENWRRRRGNEQPPPTHTGGNTPPSLPSEGTGSDREPPPTHYIPEKTPEEKPPGNSDVTQSTTGTNESAEVPRGQEGSVIDFTSYLQKHRENDIATPLESPATTPYQPIPSRLSPVPDQQTRLIPSFKFWSLSFFESGKDLPKIGNRRYNTRFPLSTSTARFINYEIALCNLLYKQEDQTHQWEVRYYNPDGTLEGTNQDGNFVTPSDCKDFCHSGGRGREQPGHWKPGTYRVIIVIDGFEFAEGSFTIE